MKCECKNCKHCRLYSEGAFCENKMIFVEPNNRCNDFDTDDSLSVWNNTLTYLAIVVVTACIIAGIIS